MTAETYLDHVADAMPKMLPERGQIVADVRAGIAERTARGEAIDAVLAKLGDPVTLVESYVSALPMPRAAFWQRAWAKMVDVAVAVLIAAPLAAVVYSLSGDLQVIMGTVFAMIGVAVLALYVLVGEWKFGQTLGKHYFHLLVVRESGTRISFGQAVVRQLPWVFEIFWIDAFFALFTDKHQRAFELLSKTRVVALRPTAEESAVQSHA